MNYLIHFGLTTRIFWKNNLLGGNIYTPFNQQVSSLFKGFEILINYWYPEWMAKQIHSIHIKFLINKYVKAFSSLYDYSRVSREAVF